MVAFSALKAWRNSVGPMLPALSLLAGYISVAGLIGVHTAKQQLCHSPGVQVTKNKRASMPEVDDPNAVIESSGKFVNKSFLRKIGQIQAKQHPHTGSEIGSRESETLESVGVRN